MITVAQAQQYLDQALGVGLPTFLLQTACDKVEAVEPDLIDAGYSEEDQVLIECMAVALVANGYGARRISSQAAPSGASRSFKNDDKVLTNLRRSLAALDPKGITAALVGPDPTASTLFMVVC